MASGEVGSLPEIQIYDLFIWFIRIYYMSLHKYARIWTQPYCVPQI